MGGGGNGMSMSCVIVEYSNKSLKMHINKSINESGRNASAPGWFFIRQKGIQSFTQSYVDQKIPHDT